MHTRRMTVIVITHRIADAMMPSMVASLNWITSCTGHHCHTQERLHNNNNNNNNHNSNHRTPLSFAWQFKSCGLADSLVADSTVWLAHHQSKNVGMSQSRSFGAGLHSVLSGGELRLVT
jgi:hypothetical protein